MKALLLPLILLLLGVGGGVGAGIFLAPPPAAEDDKALAHDCPSPTEVVADDIVAPVPAAAVEEREYAKLNNQFVVPVVEDGNVAALVVMSLNIEVVPGGREAIFSAEPKLRDRFLQVMFNHANIGGFSGNFTEGTNMRLLRGELLRAARDVAGAQVTDVLVIDMVRQDS